MPEAWRLLQWHWTLPHETTHVSGMKEAENRNIGRRQQCPRARQKISNPEKKVVLSKWRIGTVSSDAASFCWFLLCSVQQDFFICFLVNNQNYIKDFHHQDLMNFRDLYCQGHVTLIWSCFVTISILRSKLPVYKWQSPSKTVAVIWLSRTHVKLV